jgi:hypothetical protein
MTGLGAIWKLITFALDSNSRTSDSKARGKGAAKGRRCAPSVYPALTRWAKFRRVPTNKSGRTNRAYGAEKLWFLTRRDFERDQVEIQVWAGGELRQCSARARLVLPQLEME